MGDFFYRICLIVVRISDRFPAAELSCLARVLSCFPVSQRPVSVTGTCATVVAAYDKFNRTDVHGLTYSEFDPETFRRLFQQFAHHVFGSNEPFTIVEHLVFRLRSAIGEPWMEPLTTLKRCCAAGSVQFVDYCDLLLELMDPWTDVYYFIKDSGTPRTSVRRLEVGFFY